jgi:SAM-dependent methyltransferase
MLPHAGGAPLAPASSPGEGALDYLLMVSTIEPRKNQAALLDAWELLRSGAHPTCTWCSWAAGLAARRILIAASSPGWGAVACTCWPTCRRPTCARCTATPAPPSAPAWPKAFDYSGVEAMQCGGAVVASDIRVHRDVFADAAEYFNPYAARFGRLPVILPQWRLMGCAAPMPACPLCHDMRMRQAMNSKLLWRLRRLAGMFLRRRAAAPPATAIVQAGPASQPAGSRPAYSVTDGLSRETAATLGAMFAAEPHLAAQPSEWLDEEIGKLARRIEELQPGYQPVYGFGDQFPGKRAQHLERNVALVHQQLKDVVSKHQVRILDVGCNSGYVALRVAETYPNVVGLEIAHDSVRLCRLLAARAGSRARFFSDNLLDILAAGQDDLANVDLVLLYNIVHQFIFNHGLENTQAALARLVRSVDTVIVELARRENYVKHRKDHLLPEDPAEALALCEDVEITLLRERPRPVYLLRRKTARFGSVEIRPERIHFSLNPNARVSRKYYSGEGKFLKLYRFTETGAHKMFAREVAALSKLQHNDRVPRLLGSEASAHFGALLMSQVTGDRLVPRLYNSKKYPMGPADRLELTRQYLEISSVVHQAIGYQNDLQAHNLLVQPDGRLMLVDFEQAGSEPTNDPFGLLLWTVFDFWGGRDKNRPAAIRSLRCTPDNPADAPGLSIYPDFSALTLPPLVASMVEQAARGGEWGRFLENWEERLRVDA